MTNSNIVFNRFFIYYKISFFKVFKYQLVNIVLFL